VECCGGEGYQKTFTDRFARRTAKGFRARGLDATRRRLVEFLAARGIDGATVLEIGGGVGELQVELLGRGAATATNLELAASYEDEAARLLEEAGLTGRVERRFVDIAQEPGEVPEADLVVLHRVVCCYPDYEALLSAAGGHARRLLVFSFPTGNRLTRLAIGLENLQRRVRRNDFRAFVHPPERLIATAESQGLTLTYRHHTALWSIAGFERTS
jgi:magnesium-protoporphyrin O-methyltransferase